MRLLAEGRFTEAWPMFEARRRFSSPPVFEPIAQCPEWRGEPLDGKTIVVAAEQGWGDQLMFGRYLPVLANRGARIIVACHPVIAPIFATLGLATVALYTDLPLPPADYWLLIGSLPHRLGIDLPPRPIYLHLPMGSGGGIGVVTRGSAMLPNDAHRSLPKAAADQLMSLGRDLSPEATGAADFLETAGIIANLDLVITVDTAVAHLAGAMGKRCWVLLPHVGLDWRWGRSGAYSCWYPQMTLYRQGDDGDWPRLIDRVIHDAQTLIPVWTGLREIVR